MRLWAPTESITLDEFLPHLGTDVEVAFGLSVAYIAPSGLGAPAHPWPCDLTSLGAAALIQLPGIERTFTAVTGVLEVDRSEPSRWRIESVVPLTLYGPQKQMLDEGAADAL